MNKGDNFLKKLWCFIGGVLRDDFALSTESKETVSLFVPDSSVHTNAAILIQIDVRDSLQTMLEGSYKSGKH